MAEVGATTDSFSSSPPGFLAAACAVSLALRSSALIATFLLNSSTCLVFHEASNRSNGNRAFTAAFLASAALRHSSARSAATWANCSLSVAYTVEAHSVIFSFSATRTSLAVCSRRLDSFLRLLIRS